MPKKKIMIVDDEPDTIESFKTVLENAGFDIVIAPSGQDSAGFAFRPFCGVPRSRELQIVC